MARMTECLVVTRLDEQRPVATVRNNMVTVRRPAQATRRRANKQRRSQTSIPTRIPNRKLVPLANFCNLLIRHASAISLTLSLLVMPLAAATTSHSHLTTATTSKLTRSLWRNRHSTVQKNAHPEGRAETNRGAATKKPSRLGLGSCSRNECNLHGGIYFCNTASSNSQAG